MIHYSPASWIAFYRSKRIASGAPPHVVTEVKTWLDGHPQSPILLFDVETSQQVEIDFRGPLPAVLKQLPSPSLSYPSPAPEAGDETAPPPVTSGKPGRPKLGVVAREVTLLPRHWEWLSTQPGGASVALRKLVEHARKAGAETDRMRERQEAAYRFMSVMAGNERGYEEAIRSLFAGDLTKLRRNIEAWPRDVRDHTLVLVKSLGAPARERDR